ncbi:hypothetical protein [Sphingomonas sp. GB1N7]|uniref:hypothetical protein n=1 Tax=Parasphingomonas caseinilytica TaxID=3096158 RepID=UPI002FCAFA07
MKLGRLFGFADFTTNPKSGRPEAPISWVADRFAIWGGWLSTLVILAGAVFALRNHDIKNGAYLAAAALLLVAINFWRHMSLRRKRAAFAEETAAYEKAMASAFD